MKLPDIKIIFEQGLIDRIIPSNSYDCNINNLQQKILKWKIEGFTIVFTAGVFDVLTLNHLLGLYHYKILGGNNAKLVVSIDTDERVKVSKAFNKDKGSSIKPILSWKNRTMMVAKQSFSSNQNLVDLIIQHGNDTCGGIRCPHDDNVSITEVIKPDIIVVTNTSLDTIKKTKESPSLRESRLVVIDEVELSYNDTLLGEKISTGSIIKRIRNGN